MNSICYIFKFDGSTSAGKRQKSYHKHIYDGWVLRADDASYRLYQHFVSIRLALPT